MSSEFYFFVMVGLLFLAAICVSIALTNLVILDVGRKIGKILFLVTIPLLLGSWAANTKWEKESAQERATLEKYATYYEVTEETKKEIATFCEDKHVKYSTQQTCKRKAISSLKHGEKYEIFEPSSVIVKRAGVEPEKTK